MNPFITFDDKRMSKFLNGFEKKIDEISDKEMKALAKIFERVFRGHAPVWHGNLRKSIKRKRINKGWGLSMLRYGPMLSYMSMHDAPTGFGFSPNPSLKSWLEEKGIVSEGGYMPVAFTVKKTPWMQESIPIGVSESQRYLASPKKELDKFLRTMR